MEIQLMQILVVVFVLFAYSRVILRFKDKKISIKEFLFWTLIWLAIIVLVLFPQTYGLISEFLGIKRPVDLAIYVSIVIIFYLLFKVYVRIESIEQNITKIVRNNAIKKGKK